MWPFSQLYRLTFATYRSEKVRVDIEDCEYATDIKERNSVDGDHQVSNDQEMGKTGNKIANNGGDNKRSSQNDDSLPRWLAMVCCTTLPSLDENHNTQITTSSIDITPSPISDEEVAIEHAKLAQDDPKWAYLVNLAAIMIVLLCSFFWGFYA